MFSPPLEIHPSLNQITGRFNGILLDAYGVFWNGNEAGLLPGSREAMERLVTVGKVVGILSNSTQLADKERNKFHSHGLIQGRHFHFILTSGEIARHIFLNEKLTFPTINNKFWVLGGGHPRFSSHEPIFKDSSYIETSDINQADFIYVGIPHIQGEDQTDPDVFLAQLQDLKRNDLPMLCPNPDQFAHEGTPPRPVIRQGSIATLYEKMGGQVHYIGKPYGKAYAMAMKQFNQYQIFDPNKVLMIGDTPETDIRGARNYGMPSALITQTGIMADRIAHNGWKNTLKTFSSQDYPDFFIGQLAYDI